MVLHAGRLVDMVRQSSRADETRWWSDGVDVRSGKKGTMVVGDMCDGCEHENTAKTSSRWQHGSEAGLCCAIAGIDMVARCRA